MFQDTFNSETVFVIDNAWDNVSLSAEFSLIRDDQESLTGRNARRPYSLSIRVPKLEYETTVSAAALRKLQASLRALNTQPVILPLWPAVVRWSDRATAPISGGLKIVWKDDWSQWEIYTTSEPGWPDDSDNFAPALYGFLVSSEPVMRSPDCATWKVDFRESSPAAYALSPASFSPTAGPQPSGYASAPYLFPLAPDFNAVSEDISVEVRRKENGLAREQSQVYYPQIAARTQRATYTLNATDAGKLLSFFKTVAGPGASYWSSGWIQVARLTTDAASGATTLSVEDTNAVSAGDYISIFTSSGSLARKINSKTSNTITISSAPGVALDTEDTCIFPLCLAKLDKPSIKVTWSGPDCATCELIWREVSAEYVPAADETLGTTLGKLPARVILFELARNYGNGTTVTSYYTAYEKDLTWNSHTWLARGNFAHGEITQTLNLEDDGTEISCDKFTGNPLLDDLKKIAEVPLSVTIRHADYDGSTVSNPVIMFTGEAAAPFRDGNRLKVKCKFGPGILDSFFPIFVRGPVCNHLKGSNPDGSFLISAGCTLLRTNWKFTAKVVATISSAFPFAVNLNTLARVTGSAPTYFANWFAGGVIEWGTGANIQRRYITSSTNPSGGALSVGLHRYFGSLPSVNDDVVLYPGCDGQFNTCKAYNATTNPLGKFDNKPNFGGEPFTPVTNPSATGQPNIGLSGSKK